MAKPKKSTKELLKWKKKKWIEIYAPKEFNNMLLGESLVMSADQLMGKTVEANLMTLTGDIKKQNVNVKFLVTEVKDNKAKTIVTSYKITPASIKRMVRRSRDRVDHSFVAESKDGFSVRIKPLIITRNNTSKAVLTTLRKKAEFLLTKYLNKVKFQDFISDVIIHKIQKELRAQLSEVYPLRMCLVRWVTVVDKKGVKKDAKTNN